MLINFFFTLRAAKLKVSVKEYLTLLEAIEAGVIDDGDEGPTIDRFYYLCLLYTSPSPRDLSTSRMPSSA